METKAWGVNWDKIEEGEYYNGCLPIVYAENRNKAKALLIDAGLRDYKLYSTGEDVTYLNAPIKRLKRQDLVEFEGGFLSKDEIDDIKLKRKRLGKLETILRDKDITHCYIYKGGYYKPDMCGYTDIQARAGVYIKQEAVDHAKHCREVTVIPIETKKHNKMILEEIEDLKKKII
jgi:hypothetical protein